MFSREPAHGFDGDTGDTCRLFIERPGATEEMLIASDGTGAGRR